MLGKGLLGFVLFLLSTVNGRRHLSVNRVEHINYCQPCREHRVNELQSDISGTALRQIYINVLVELDRLLTINTEEMCRIYYDFFEGDVSVADFFNHTMIPLRLVPNVIPYRTFSVEDAYDKLVTYMAYYKVSTIGGRTTNGISLPNIQNKMDFILCSLHTAYRHDGVQIPQPVCRKSLELQRRPDSRAEFAMWLFAVLRHGRHSLCQVFNDLSSSTALPKMLCNSIPNVNTICQRQ